ncbi:MAG: UPF0175 family protein [Acidobacteria bacterium]|nr:UPF0175 family protein [Acidobacteriota bacterium]
MSAVKMSAVKIEVELPRDLVAALNVDPSELGLRAREWILLELFQEGIISSGKAAEVLGMTKSAFLQLLDLHGLAYLDASLDDLERQQEVAMSAVEGRRGAS